MRHLYSYRLLMAAAAIAVASGQSAVARTAGEQEATKPASEDAQQQTSATTVTVLQEGADHLQKRAEILLERVNRELGQWKNKESIANWNYASDLTEENMRIKLNVSTEVARFTRATWEVVAAFPWRDINDYNLRRQFEKLSVLGYPALPEDLYMELQKTISDMENIYSTAKICAYNDETKCDLALEPDITELLSTSRDPEQLKHLWVEWRKASGEKVKSLYPRYVELSNMAARQNNYSDTAAFWLREYETDDFPEQIDSLWRQARPLYLQLHAYVRRELRKKYGESVVSKDGPIPAHLLGNMWAQTWSDIAPFTTPFPGEQLADVTAALVEQGYNATSMFRLAESFFVSLNMSAMPDTFWESSILTKKEGREMVCHASAWDFYDGKDFRIKQCTRVNVEDLRTVHHEMGHVEYFLQYKHQPTVFREGANPAFHEAVGDVIALSVSTPGHLRTIGLLRESAPGDAAMLNHLYATALEKIVFLPFAYAMDKWRWNVFQGKVTPDNYNCHWWQIAEELQGIEPPVDRSEEDFDPGAKYHVIADVEYLRYYVSFVIQFQFHKALCIAAKQYDPQNETGKPLYDCDIYNSKHAGNLLKSMLELGSSKPWQDAMEKITGQREIDAAGLLEYFEPLTEWLRKENAKTNEYVGWKSTSRSCVQTRGELAASSADADGTPEQQSDI